MTQQQQHIIGLTEFLMIAGKVYRNRDDTVQLLKSFDRSKVLDEGWPPPDAFTFPAKISTEDPPSSTHSGAPGDFEPSC